MDLEKLKLLVEEQRRARAQGPQNFQQAMAPTHRDMSGNIVSQDPVERARQKKEEWDLIFHGDETPEQKAVRQRAARASNGMDALNQWAIALGDTQLAQDMQAGKQARQLQNDYRRGGLEGITRTWRQGEASPYDGMFAEGSASTGGKGTVTFPNQEETKPSGFGIGQTDPVVREKLEKRGGIPGLASASDIAAAGGSISPVTLLGTGPNPGGADSTFGRTLSERAMTGASWLPNAAVDLGSGVYSLITGKKVPRANYLASPWANFMAVAKAADANPLGINDLGFEIAGGNDAATQNAKQMEAAENTPASPGLQKILQDPIKFANFWSNLDERGRMTVAANLGIPLQELQRRALASGQTRAPNPVANLNL